MTSLSSFDTVNSPVHLSLVAESATGTAKSLYEVLVDLALDYSEAKSYKVLPAFATYHSSLELLASTAGVSRVSTWRHLQHLKVLGLVDYRPKKVAYRGKTYNSGCVFQVKLNLKCNSKAKLSYQDMKHDWRDLNGAVKAGRTSYRALKHTKELKTKSLRYEVLKSFTLSPCNDVNPDSLYVSPSRPNIFGGGLETVLDVLSTPKEGVNKAVDLASEALAQALRDSRGRNYYRKLLWQLVRRYKATGEDYSQVIYNLATRARTDAIEGMARKPGAVFTSRLMQASWYQWVIDAPKLRVGIRPN